MHEIIEKIIQNKSSKVYNYPVRSNWASLVGDPCARKLVYYRLNWEEKILHDGYTQLLFEDGNIHEEKAIRDLKEAGIEVYEQQRPFQWKDLQISGKIDFRVRMNGSVYTVEFKAMNQYIWDSINTIEEFNKYSWTKKYLSQLNMYLFMSEETEGLFMLKNKSSGQYKIIPAAINWDLADETVTKIEKVNEQVEKGTNELDRIDDREECKRCPFNHICLTDVDLGDGLAIDDSKKEQIEGLLQVKEENKVAHSAYEGANKALKPLLKEVSNTIVGNYLIDGKWIEIEDRVQKGYKYWKPSITKLGEVEADG